MFITKKHLSRRTFLKGAGVTVALPLLESMVPAQTPLAKTAANPRARFGFIYFPHGSIMKQWTPATEGANFEFSPILKPLEPYRNKITVLSGFNNEGEPGHSVSAAMYMSGTKPTKGNVILLNTTVDQIIAQQIGQDSTFPSMEFATEDHSSHIGSCAGDYLCAYMSTVSWRTPTQPLPMELNPRVVFERMFGSDQATPAQRKARMQQNISILDEVNDSIKDLNRGLGPKDQAKLNEYLENVREIERRVTQSEKQRSERAVEAPETPVGIPGVFEDHVGLMFELMAIAYQGELTRVQSFMMARELSTLSYPQIGVQDGHHPVSHNNNVPEQVAKKARIDTYHNDLFARFLGRLQNTPDGDGNLLDHSLFLYGSGMSNGNAHVHNNLPALLAGGGAGLVKGNQHIKVKEDTPFANVLLTLINLAGVKMDKYGDSNGLVEI